jgi:hypothetical protein
MFADRTPKMTQRSSIAEQFEAWPIFVFCGAWSGSGCLILLIILGAFLYCERRPVPTRPRAVEPANSVEIRRDSLDDAEFAEK